MATDLTALTATTLLTIRMTTGKTSESFADPTDSVNRILTTNMTFGALANMANQLWYNSATLAAGADVTFDLVSGGLTNVYGGAVALTKVKVFAVFNTGDVQDTPSTATITLGGGSDAWSAAFDTAVIAPGGVFLITAPDVDGIAVTSSTGDKILLTNNDGSQTAYYDIIVAGVSA